MKECEGKNRRGLSTMHSYLMCSLAVFALGVHIMIQITSCQEVSAARGLWRWDHAGPSSVKSLRCFLDVLRMVHSCFARGLWR
jgi:hypothetical protein